MPYTPTTFTDNTTPLFSAAEANKIGTGIQTAQSTADLATERAFIIGKAGVIGATETDASDFFFIAPFNGTFLRMKSVVKTAVSGAMAVQLRTATAPTNSISWANVSSFVTTFTGTGYFVATVDPANVNFGEGDLIGFSASTGSGSDLLIEVVAVAR